MNPRVTAPMRKAVEELFAQGRPSAEETCLAVLTAEDHITRFCVVTLSGQEVQVFGPYATYASAGKAIDSGLASKAGTRGAVLPLIPAPKAERKGKA